MQIELRFSDAAIADSSAMRNSRVRLTLSPCIRVKKTDRPSVQCLVVEFRRDSKEKGGRMAALAVR
jgi:hypothetical protein